MDINCETSARTAKIGGKESMIVSASYSFPEENKCSGQVIVNFHLFDTELKVSELDSKIRSEAAKILNDLATSLEQN